MKNKPIEPNQQHLSLDEIMKLIDRTGVKYVTCGASVDHEPDSIYVDKHSKRVYHFDLDIFDVTVKRLRNLFGLRKSARVVVLSLPDRIVIANYKGSEVYPHFERIKSKYDSQNRARDEKKREALQWVYDRAKEEISKI